MANILLIEADRPLAASLQKFLTNAGHTVDWNVDPQAAMDSADSQRPDLVIMDLMLAGRSGVEFLYEFRSYPEWQELPIVVFSNISAGDLGSSAIGFEELSISAFHYKPATTFADLSQSVERLLQPA